MAIWLIRAGTHGEHEQKFIQENRVYVTWDELDENLAKLTERSELVAALTRHYPDAKPRKISNHASQIWPFAHEMKKGDLVVLPLKSQPAIQIGEITGDYHFTKPLLPLAAGEMDRRSSAAYPLQPGLALHLWRFPDYMSRRT
jgi:restriction system protein